MTPTPPYTPPPPAGFGNCPGCAYLRSGSVQTCHACASEKVKAPGEPNCPVCHQAVAQAGATCSNWLCNDRARAFKSTAVIGVKAGVLEQSIWDMKAGAYGWGMIFARIVLGYLYARPAFAWSMDAIIPMPAYRQPDEPRQGKDHTGYVIERAIEEDDRGLPFVLDPPLIEKTTPTKRMRDTSGAGERRSVSQNLFDVLQVPDPDRVRGKNILIYDDVFTTGNTLNAVARRLKASGAKRVYGLTLARQQWRT